MSPDLARRNRRVAFGAFGFVAFMVGVSFAAVPLYDLFCRVTGFNGTVQIGRAAPGAATEQTITVRFNATTHPSLPWRFEPQQASLTLRLGDCLLHGLVVFADVVDLRVPRAGARDQCEHE